MTVAGDKTVTIAYKDDPTIVGSVTFTVYDPADLITPAEGSNVTRVDKEIEGVITSFLIVNVDTLAGVDSATFLENDLINEATCLKVYKADGTEVTSGKLATGYIVKLYASTDTEFLNPIDEAIAVVKGDVNGDGKISAMDYGKIKTYIMDEVGIDTPAQQMAADFNNDGNISAKDYGKIKTLIMEE